MAGFYNPVQNYGTGLDQASDFVTSQLSPPGNQGGNQFGGRGGFNHPILNWLRGFRNFGNQMQGGRGMNPITPSFSFNPGQPTPDTLFSKPQPGGVGYENAPTPGGVPQVPPYFNNGQGTAWGAVPVSQRNQFLPALENGRRTYKPPQRVY